MKLLKIPFKNITLNKKRSLALFLFMFISAFFLVIFLNLIGTINSNMTNSLKDSITGDVQLRPADTEEKEMVSLSESWSGLVTFDSTDTDKIQKSLDKIKGITYEQRLRGEGTLESGITSVTTKFIGCDGDGYKGSVSLLEGSYLNEDSEDEILLTQTVAEQLGVDIGDTITILYSKDNQMATTDLTLQGIIEMPLLSMFGVDSAYIKLSKAQELYGYDDNTCSEILVSSAGNKTEIIENKVTKQLKNIDETGKTIKITNWEEMGGTILGGIQLYETMFLCFIVVYLIIIAILVINLVFMMGTERMKDIGTMKAIGFSRKHIVFLFVAEITIISAVGDFIGCIGGVITSILLSHTSLSVGAPMNFVLGNEFSLKFNPMFVVPIFVLILVYGCIVALYPSCKLSKRNAVETLIDM